MAVLFGAGVGYWVDWRWDTTPFGVIIGLVIGFAAMVLRLLRLGQELVPGAEAGAGAGSEGGTRPAGKSSEVGGSDGESGSDQGPAESPALFGVWRDVWRDDAADEPTRDAADERKSNERE